MEVTGENKIHSVIGGFHLIDKSESQIKDLIAYLKTQNINTLYPCHCCDLKSKLLLSQKLQIHDICVGDCISFFN